MRLATWNVKHFGATKRTTRTSQQEYKKAHDNERARNLVEVIYQSRACLVVLQEIAKTADLGFLCGLLEKRYGLVEAVEYEPDSKFQVWRSTDVVGEHVMLYQTVFLAAALDCDTAALKEVTAARLPAVFFAHNGKDSREFKSVAVCSVHLAFGQGGKSETRFWQLQNLASLVPGPRCDRL